MFAMNLFNSTLIGLSLAAVVAVDAAEDPFREMFSVRTSIDQAIGGRTWMVSYIVGSNSSIKASGMSKEGRVFKLEGRLKPSVAAPDPLLLDAYEKLDVSFSDERGDLYQIDIFGGKAQPIHWTYDAYRSFLEEFRHYGFENKLKKSPRKYALTNEAPEVLLAAIKLKPARSKIGPLMDNRVGVLGFFSAPLPDGSRKVSHVIEKSAAEYAGLLKDDVIVGIRCDYEKMDFEGFSVALRENVGIRFDFHVKRGQGSKQLVMFRPSPLEQRLLSMPEPHVRN